MGRDAELGVTVHLLGADLDLDGLALVADDDGVDGLVAVRLRVRDIVVELARYMVPVGVDHAEGRVAVVDLLDDDAHCPDVIELGELKVLLLHLAPDAVNVLGPPVDIGLDPVLGKSGPELGDELVDVGLAVNPLLVEEARDLLVDVGMQVAEGEILKLPLELSDAESVRERRVNRADFLGDEDSGLLRGALHLAEYRDPLGKLDADRADILNHGDEHAPDLVDLLLRHLIVRDVLQALDGLHVPGA